MTPVYFWTMVSKNSKQSILSVKKSVEILLFLESFYHCLLAVIKRLTYGKFAVHRFLRDNLYLGLGGFLNISLFTFWAFFLFWSGFLSSRDFVFLLHYLIFTLFGFGDFLDFFEFRNFSKNSDWNLVSFSGDFSLRDFRGVFAFWDTLFLFLKTWD